MKTVGRILVWGSTAAMIGVLLFGTARGQQPTLQGTPAGPNTPVFNGWRPSNRTARTPTAPQSFTVRMEDQHGSPCGSGTLIQWGGKTHVLSARHLNWNRITHANLGGQRLPILGGRQVYVSRDSDVALACLRDGGIQGGTLAQSTRGGDRLTLAGYPMPRHSLAIRTGTIWRRHGASEYDITALANFGDSGGSVFDSRGQVCGVLVAKDADGSAPGRGNVVSVREVRKFLARAANVHADS